MATRGCYNISTLDIQKIMVLFVVEFARFLPSLDIKVCLLGSGSLLHNYLPHYVDYTENRLLNVGTTMIWIGAVNISPNSGLIPQLEG